MAPIDPHPTALRAHAALLAACVAASLAGCGGANRSRGALEGPAPRGAHASAGAADTVGSNVVRGDYAGSAACVPCHADVATAWERSPMHRMTRDARGADIRAPFDGATLKFKDDEVVLERRGDDRFVRIEHGGAGAVADERSGANLGRSTTYRVTRVIGGRVREDFAGVEVGGHGEEVVLPVSYLIASGTLRYKGYSVMVHERATVRAGPIWSRSCIFCHNTVPEMDWLLGAIAGPRAPGYQGEQVDRWLPVERRAQVRVTDDRAFASAAGAEIARLGGTGAGDADGAPSLARRALDVVRSGFDGAALIEVGIGCEACHGGSREHARDPRRRPSFVSVAPWLEAAAPAMPSKPAPPPGGSVPASAPTEAQAINRACARCHQVLFSRYPFTWEGGRRDGTAGGSHINSGEGRDFLLGGCAGAMACTSCHDPHGADDAAKLRALATPAGNTTCTGCHSELADRQRLQDHAHHDPDGAGGSCVACHMPRKNMGLDGTLTRYHRIGSPTDAARVLGDRPLECALCHADRSAGSLVDAMERWWPVRYPRQRIAELYGSLDANVMRATLERGKPHEQAVAMATLGGARDCAAAPLIARQLLGEYPLVREWAKRALTSILGRCDVDCGR